MDRQENVANANFPSWSRKRPRRWRAGTQTPKRGFWNGHNTCGGQKGPRSIFLPRWHSHSRVLRPAVVPREGGAPGLHGRDREGKSAPGARLHHRRPRQPSRSGVLGRQPRVGGAHGEGWKTNLDGGRVPWWASARSVTSSTRRKGLSRSRMHACPGHDRRATTGYKSMTFTVPKDVSLFAEGQRVKAPAALNAALGPGEPRVPVAVGRPPRAGGSLGVHRKIRSDPPTRCREPRPSSAPTWACRRPRSSALLDRRGGRWPRYSGRRRAWSDRQGSRARPLLNSIATGFSSGTCKRHVRCARPERAP